MSALASFLAAAALATCPVSHVHYRSYTAVGAGLERVPWIETSNHAFYGHLFYYGGTPWARTRPLGARIFTTVVSRQINPKVLWISRRGEHMGRLRIHGQRIGAEGSFDWAESYVGAYQFPSYVEIPAAGCWRVTISAGGLSGSVVFGAVDSF